MLHANRIILKSISMVLVAMMLLIDASWAAGSRRSLAEDQAMLRAMQEGRRLSNPGRDSSNGYFSGGGAGQAVSQQKDLQELEALQFSLTTESGDLIEYIGDKIQKITRPDGFAVLENIELNEDQTIHRADLTLADGSFQVLEDGRIVEYRRPDGRVLHYEAGVLVKELSSDGETETLYATDANTGYVTAENSDVLMVFDENGVLKSLYKKADDITVEFGDGILMSVTTASERFEYERIEENGQIIARSTSSTNELFKDDAGNEFVFEDSEIVSIRLVNGEVISGLEWAGDNSLLRYSERKTVDGRTIVYQYDGDDIVSIRVTGDEGALVYAYAVDGKGGKVVQKADRVWTYQDELFLQYQDDAVGIINYLYVEGELHEIHRQANASLLVYNADRKIIRRETASDKTLFFVDEPYAGYARERFVYATNRTHTYSYHLDSNSKLIAEEQIHTPFPTNYLREDYKGHRQLNRSKAPSTEVRFSLSDAVAVSPLLVLRGSSGSQGLYTDYYAVIMQRDSMYVSRLNYNHSTGESSYYKEDVDYELDLESTYDLSTAWVDDKVNVYIAKNGGDVQLIHQSHGVDWNPQLNVRSSDLPFTLVSSDQDDFTHHESVGGSGLDKNKNYDAEFVMSDTIHSLDYEWVVNGERITMQYDNESKKAIFQSAGGGTSVYFETPLILSLNKPFIIRTKMTDDGLVLKLIDKVNSQSVSTLAVLQGLVAESFDQKVTVNGGDVKVYESTDSQAVTPILASDPTVDDYYYDWVFDNAVIQSVGTPELGQVDFLYEDGVVVGYAHVIGGMRVVYDIDGVAQSATKNHLVFDFHQVGEYAGYIKSEYDSDAEILYDYEYDRDEFSNIRAHKISKNRMPWNGLSEAQVGVGHADQTGDPNMTVNFDFKTRTVGKPSLALRAENNETAYARYGLFYSFQPNGIQMSYEAINHQTYEWFNDDQEIDYTFDPNLTYTASLRWESGIQSLYVTEAGGEEQMVHSMGFVEWNPRMSAVAYNLSMDIVQYPDVAYDYTQTFEGKDILTSAWLTGEYKADADSSNQKGIEIQTQGFDNDNKSNLNLKYDVYTQSFKTSVYRKNLDLGRYEVVDGGSVFFAFDAGTQYQYKATFDEGAFRFKIWVMGEDEPEAFLVENDEFKSGDFKLSTMNYGGVGKSEVHQDVLVQIEVNHHAMNPEDLDSALLTSLIPPIYSLYKIHVPDGPPLPAGYPSEMRYDSEKNVTDAFIDNKHYTFSDGSLQSVKDLVTNEILSLEQDISFLGNLVSLRLDNSEIKSDYDENGRLSSVEYDGVTVHYLKDSDAIDYLSTDTGNEIYSPVFADGKIVSAEIYDSEGNLRIYQEGRLERLVREDGNAYSFNIVGDLLEWLTPDGFHYSFDYSDGDKILAALDNEDEVEITDTMIRTYEFANDLSLSKMIRENKDIISFTNDKRIDLINYGSDEEDQRFEYLPNGHTVMTQGNAITIYDENDNPVNTKVSGADGSLLDIDYRYGKIRTVKRDGELIYEYSYEFDEANVEYTMINDLIDKQVKRYLDKQLLNTIHVETKVESHYTYDTSNRVSHVAVTRHGRSLHDYDYRYEDDTTIVMDEKGVERFYDVSKELFKLIRDKVTYLYDSEISRSAELVSFVPDLSADDANALFDKAAGLHVDDLSFLQTHTLDSSDRLLAALTTHGQLFEFIYLSGGEVEVVQSEAGVDKHKFNVMYDASNRIDFVKRSYAVEPNLEPSLYSEGIEPVVSSTLSEDAQERLMITNGVFGDEEKGWKGANADGSDTIELDLGSSKTLDHLMYDTRSGGDSGLGVGLGGAYQDGFKISTSLDGVNWTLAHQASNIGSPRLISIEMDVVARYLRVHDIEVNNMFDPNVRHAQVSELQVFIAGSADWVWEAEATFDYSFDEQDQLTSIREAHLDRGQVIQVEPHNYAYKKIVTEELSSKELNDGSMVYYDSEIGSAGDINRIEYVDGRIITDVIVDRERKIQSATITDNQTQIQTLYREGEIIGQVYPDGREFYYEMNSLIGFNDAILGLFAVNYVQDGGVDQEVVLTRGDLELHYDASHELDFAKLLTIDDAETVMSGVEHDYMGGYGGRLGVDGDFETSHRDQRRHSSGGAGHITSTFILPSAQTLDTLTYKMAAAGEAHGAYIKDYYARGFVEVLIDDVWNLVPGTFHGVNRQFGDGGTSFDTGIVEREDLNISGIEGVRVIVNGFGNSSDGGNANGSASLYELQFTLKDESIFDAVYSGDALALQSVSDALTYDVNGVYAETGNEALDGPASEINNIAHLISELPHASRRDIALPSDFGAVYDTTVEAVLEASVLVRQEYDTHGSMEVQTKADKTVTLFDENKPTFVYDEFGNELIRYTYVEGNLSRVHLTNARDVLPERMRATRSRIYLERRNALLDLATQKELAFEQIERDSNELRVQVQSHLDYWSSKADSMSNKKVKGKAARMAVAGAVTQLNGAVNQLQGQIDQINQQEADAYAQLDVDVQTAKDKINDDTQTAFAELYRQKLELEEEITRQEVSPVIYDTYRRLLGRDPTSAEYQFWIDRTDFKTGQVYFDQALADLRKEPIATSMHFNGIDSKLSIQTHESLEFGSADFAIDFWANFSDQDKDQALFDFGGGNGVSGYFRASSGEIVFDLAGEEYAVDWTPDTSVFHHFAFTRDRGVVKVFINGQRVLKDPSADVIDENGASIHYNYDVNDRLKDVRVVKDGDEKLFSAEGFLKREVLATGVTKHYGYSFDKQGILEGVKLIERTPELVGGELPYYDAATGRFTRLSAFSAGLIDGYTSAVYSNDQGMGAGNYNYYREQNDRWTGRGMDVAIVNERGDLIKSDIFDTYSSSAESTRLAHFLEDVAPGHYAIIAASDEVSKNLNGRAMLAIESFGSAFIGDLEYWESWAMIGVKGGAKGTAIEEHKLRSEGPAEVRNYNTVVSHYDAEGTPVHAGDFYDLPIVEWTSKHGYDSDEHFESLGDLSDGRVSGFFKNYNESEVHSGFYNVSDDPTHNFSEKLADEDFITQIMKAAEHATQRVVYYDDRYADPFVSDAEMLVFANRLEEEGYIVMDSDELAVLLEEPAVGVAIVFATGIIPDSIYDRDEAKNIKLIDKVRPFLEAGGTFVWTTNTPFFDIGDTNSQFRHAGEIGLKEVLGVTPIYSRAGKVYKTYTELHEFNAVDNMFTGKGYSYANGDVLLGSSQSGTSGKIESSEFYDKRSSHYTTLPKYKVHFNTGEGAEGLQLGITGKSWSGFDMDLYVRKEGDLLNFYYGGANLVGSMSVDAKTDYYAEFILDFKTVSLYVYKEGEEKPEDPMFTKSNQLWLNANFFSSIDMGQAKIHSIEFSNHSSELLEAEKTTRPTYKLTGDEVALDLASLSYDVGTNLTDLSGYEKDILIGASFNDARGLFEGYLEEFRVSSGDARCYQNFPKPDVRYLPDTFTSLLIRSDAENLALLQDYSEYDHSITKLGTVDYSTEVYKFEKSFLGGLTDTRGLVFPGPSTYFDGVSGYIVAKENEFLDVTQDSWSSDMWVQPEELGKVQTLFSQGSDLNNYATLNIEEDGSISFTMILNGSKVIDLRSDLKIRIDEWSHVAISRENMDLKLFVNGKREGYFVLEALQLLEPIGAELFIGRFGASEELRKQSYGGYMDEFIFSTDTRFRKSFTPSREETVGFWQKRLVLRESFFLKETFYNTAPTHVLLEFADGVFPDQHNTPMNRPPTKALDLVITGYINESQEIYQRTAYVNSIKASVEEALDVILDNYLVDDVITQEGKDAMESKYGINAAWIPNLTSFELRRINDAYIQTRSLHFGQSAFLALESMLDQKGVHYAREDLAIHAIMIDILAGIISPLDDGDLVLSMFSLLTVAEAGKISSETTSLRAMNLSWDDLRAIFDANENARVVAHISGNHYVIVTHITEDTITYTDPGIGKDKENEILTITKEGFLDEWEGNVFSHHDDSLVVVNNAGEAVREGSLARELSVEETMTIRGAFWGSLLNIIATVVAIALIPATGGLSAAMWSPWVIGIRIGAIVASIIEGDFLTAISTVVTIGLSWGFSEGGFLTNMFSGAQAGAEVTVPTAKEALTSSAGFFGQIFDGVSGFLAPVFNGFQALFDWIPGVSSLTLGNFTQTVIGIGLNFGISAGLTAIGVDPEIAGFASNLITGAILGAVDPDSGTVLKGAEQLKGVQTNLYQTITFSDVGRLGRDLEWDTGFTQLAAISLGAIQGNLISHPNNALKDVFKEIGPQLSQSYASYGVGLIGDAVGLDPRISSILGSTISGGIGGAFQQGANVGQNIISAINNGLLTGATDLAISYAVDELELDPLLGALSVNALTGGILGAFSDQGNILKGAFDSFGRSALNILTFGAAGLDPNDPNYAYRQAQYISRIQSFSDALVADSGGTFLEKFGNVLEAHATQVFTRGGIENIWNNGGIADYLMGTAESVTVNGVNLTRVNAGSENNGEYLYYDPATFNLVGREYFKYSTRVVPTVDGPQEVIFRDKVVETNAEYGFDENGNFGIINGDMTVSSVTNSYGITASVVDGTVIAVNINDSNSNVVVPITANSDAGIRYDAETDALRDADLELPEGYQISLKDGFKEIYEAPLLAVDDEDPLSLGLTSSDDYLFESLGITTNDLTDISVRHETDLNTGQHQIKYISNNPQNPHAVNDLLNKISNPATNPSFTTREEALQRFHNVHLLLGARTHEEISLHKESEVQRMINNSDKIYIVHNAEQGYAYNLIRSKTRIGDEKFVVNHSGIAFKHTDGKMYVADMIYQSNTKSDLRIIPLDDWKQYSVDIVAQEMPFDQQTAHDFLFNTVYDKYVNQADLKPKKEIDFNWWGILNPGYTPTADGSKRFCSEWIALDLFEPLGINVTDYNTDGKIDPNELRHYINAITP